MLVSRLPAWRSLPNRLTALCFAEYVGHAKWVCRCKSTDKATHREHSRSMTPEEVYPVVGRNVEQAMKTLLSEKHLYQAVDVDLSFIPKMAENHCNRKPRSPSTSRRLLWMAGVHRGRDRRCHRLDQSYLEPLPPLRQGPPSCCGHWNSWRPGPVPTADHQHLLPRMRWPMAVQPCSGGLLLRLRPRRGCLVLPRVPVPAVQGTTAYISWCEDRGRG